MDFKELVKKYWFVGVIGIVLIVFVGIYAVDAYKNRERVVSSKQVDGKYAVYSVDGDYVFADDFYKSLYDDSGAGCIMTALQKIVFESYETTDEMNTQASNYASYYLQYYGREYFDSYLKSMGYLNGANDLVQYFIDMQKYDLLIQDYIKAHKDEYNTFVEQYNPRIVYHILVSVADVPSSTDEDGNTTYTANPTDEEKQKLQDVLNALKTESFEDVAKQYSDDTGSGEQGGYIGCVTSATTNYVAEFKNAAMELAEGQVSEPVLSQYGYHIIKNVGNNLEDLVKDSEFLTEYESFDQNISVKAIIEKANELGYEIKDEAFLNLINEALESEVSE